ncbi:hypothetical protein GXP67_03525 [Rhodocytophaga rosea]|uniref:Uncharacterized protein n=1 Tax=Rhodocytophaga rosea TaxID=2704465 RepID=A0A6C0GCU4_9BACT|nr:hypothetical protein [Rhodocytophaga rosea]QHT65799.1 hypothetical protein GXP67_03525 [Rhodocytophaga rosea]
MSILAVFGICLVIVVVFLIIVGVMTGSQFFVLFIFFPVLISEAITGQRGSFHPNGATRKKPFFEGVLLLSVVFQVLLLSGILFGIYGLFAGFPVDPVPAVTEDTAIRNLLTPAEISGLLVINSVLWLFAVGFAGMLLINTVRYRKEINLMPKGNVLTGYVLPFFLFLIAFYFLFASRNYLALYPKGESQLSRVLLFMTIFYGMCLLFFKIKDIYLYFTLFRKRQIPLWKGYWLTMSLSILYTLLFQYFLIRILLSL